MGTSSPVTGLTHAIVGREAEIALVDDVLALVPGGPVAVLIDGEVGIGKTRLLTERVAAVEQRGWTVLQCRPVESEAPLAYAALGDLLRDVADEDFAALPAPQRRALDVALLREEPDDRHPLPQAAAVGLLGVLTALAARRPTIVVIDDVQWLDVESQRALVFAARRVTEQRLGFLLTRRTDAFASGASDATIDATLVQTLPSLRRLHLDLRLLDANELGQVLQVHLGVQVPRRTLTRLHETSRGNPYFAIEIARAMLQRGVLEDGDADVPIPPNLQELARGRLAQLPVDTMRIVQLAAATTRPTLSIIDAAFAGEDVGPHLRAASDAGIIEVSGERVTFTHPLLASVAYMRATARERRSIHERLANVLDDPEERGRHLALAVDEPSATVARALDDAANRARQRGAPDAAASLLEHARRLTPPGDHERAQRRGIEAAERHYEAGDVGRSRAVLEEVLISAQSGHERARALARLGWVRSQVEGFGAGAQAFRAALGELAEDGDDASLRVEIEQGLAWCLHSTLGLAPALPHAHASLRYAEQLGDRSLLAGALSYVALLDSVSGEGIATETIDRAIALGHCPSWSQILGRPDWIQALLLAWNDQLDDARIRFIELLDEAREHGDEHALPVVYFQLARTELLLGRWDEAADHARDCLESTTRSGQVGQRPYALTIGALVHAHTGLVDDARAEIDEGRRIADTLGTVPAGLEIRAAQGFLELSLGENELAAVTLDELADDVTRFGFREPSMFRFHGDAIEARLASGRVEDARRLLGDFDRVGHSLGRSSVAMVADRARGLLAAIAGDFDGAYAAFARSLGVPAPSQPFERARTLLALGTVQRRDRKRRAARDSLTAAYDAFEHLGAPLWSAKAHAELERTGGAVADDAGLTVTEGRIAELIAAGRTYREAADELFISPKTVQWNLSKIYRKLGIRSRAQLAAHFREHGGAPVAVDD